jgi:hypothetical protein
VTFRKILKAAADKEIVELVREVAQNSSRIIILARYGTLSLTSILDYLNNLAGYAYFARGKRVITLIYSYGEKGSIFVKAYAKALFEMINIDLKISSIENSHDRSMTDTILPFNVCHLWNTVCLLTSKAFSQLFEISYD